MATIFMAEKSFTPYKQLKSIPKRNMGAGGNLAPPTNTINGGADGGLFFPQPQSLPSRTQTLISSSSNRKNNRNKDRSLTPKRSKSRPFIATKNQYLKPTEDVKKQAVLSKSTVGPLGPDPNDLPKVLGASYIATATEKFSGSGFTLSPPPSSLPLPKFSLQPKLISCNVEAAAGVDVGATDDLRRLLRLC